MDEVQERDRVLHDPAYLGAVHVDWAQSTLDISFRCYNCGAVNQLRDVFPDLAPRCYLCGFTHPAHSNAWEGDEHGVIRAGYELRQQARVQWMLDEAIREHEPIPGRNEYRYELAERCQAAFDGEVLCVHLQPKAGCVRCMGHEQVLEMHGEISRLKSDRGCTTCHDHTAVMGLGKAWFEERRLRQTEGARAEERITALRSRMAELEAEIARRKTGG